LVVDAENEFVIGLLFACDERKSPYHNYVIPIDKILSYFKVDLVCGHGV